MFGKKRNNSRERPDDQSRARMRYSERSDAQQRGSVRSFSYQARGGQTPVSESLERKPRGADQRSRLRATDSVSLAGGQSRRERLKRAAQHIPGVLVVLLLLVSIGYNLGVSTNPRVQLNGEVAAQSTQQHEEFERIVTSAFEQLPATSRTKLTFDTETFSNQLQKEHPELGGVRVSLPFFGQRPVVHLETPPRSFVYTGADGRTAVLDSSGRVLSLGSASDLPRVTDTASLELAIGKQVLPSDEAAFMRLVYDELAHANVKVESFSLPPIVKRLEFKVQGSPYVVRMTMQHAPAEQVGAYLATRENMTKQGIAPGEYIDVRVAGRIYYK